jgi:hypothetical protein
VSDIEDVAKAARENLEKRRFERMKAGLQIKWRPVTAGEEATLVKAGGYAAVESFHSHTAEITDFNKVISEDVSLGGLKISTAMSMPIGTRLWVQISLPDVPVPVNAIAEVRWCESVASAFLSGLKFLTISKSDLDKVERYLVLQKRASMSRQSGT